MFTDEKTGIIIHANLNETVIHATLRTYDLYHAFMEVIKDTPEYVQMINTVPAYALEDDQSEYWDEDIQYIVNESLFDCLNSYAPEGYYFGSGTEGDGSDFGFWTDFEEHGVYTISNSCRYLIEISNDGDSARVKDGDKISGWFEIVYIFNPEAEGDQDEPWIDPYPDPYEDGKPHFNIPLNQVMRIN